MRSMSSSNRVKASYFELDERVLLAVSTEANAFLQMVEGEKVVLPLRVYDIEQDAAFEPAQRRCAEERLFFVIARLSFFQQHFGEAVVTYGDRVDARRFQVEAELIEQLI